MWAATTAACAHRRVCPPPRVPTAACAHRRGCAPPVGAGLPANPAQPGRFRGRRFAGKPAPTGG
ncbi:MAG TPA: hypothetical protein ENK12_12180 [Gammaproteobacteria bacterium]|nr:hypothetical protein [Gammaproteobacteria bacterium]